MNYLAGICPGALCAPIFSPLPTFFSPISLWFTAFSSWALLFPPLSAYFFDSACYYSSRNFFVECRRQRWKAIWKANSVLRSCCQEKPSVLRSSPETKIPQHQSPAPETFSTTFLPDKLLPPPHSRVGGIKIQTWMWPTSTSCWPVHVGESKMKWRFF